MESGKKAPNGITLIKYKNDAGKVIYNQKTSYLN
jgi:hypothetical protein